MNVLIQEVTHLSGGCEFSEHNYLSESESKDESVC